jgi:alpha-tubulin suppressor-like RCC1 family protein
MYTIIGGNVFKWDFSTTPTQLTFGGTATEISASVTHISVRLSDGTVWSWGQNNYGQLGNNTLVASTAPVQASGLSGITKVVAGNGFTVALDKYGNVFTWGGSTSYGLNTLPKKAGVYPTVKVPHQAAISTVKDIDAGAYQVIALKEDNSVWVWGYTDYINNSTTNYSYNTTYLPTNISELGVNTTKIAAGWDQMLTLGFDDKLHNWAGNNTGKLGDGTTTERHAPVSVAFTLPVVITPPLTTPPPSTTCDDDNGHGNGVGHGEGNCGHNNGNGSGGSDNGNGNSNNTPNPIVCTKVKNVTTCTN